MFRSEGQTNGSTIFEWLGLGHAQSFPTVRPVDQSFIWTAPHNGNVLFENNRSNAFDDTNKKAARLADQRAV